MRSENEAGDAGPASEFGFHLNYNGKPVERFLQWRDLILLEFLKLHCGHHKKSG